MTLVDFAGSDIDLMVIADALDYAHERGVGEAVFANTAGNLCEGTGSNVFYVIDGELRTPTLDSGCLAGISRGLVLEWGNHAAVTLDPGLSWQQYRTAIEDRWMPRLQRALAEIRAFGPPAPSCNPMLLTSRSHLCDRSPSSSFICELTASMNAFTSLFTAPTTGFAGRAADTGGTHISGLVSVIGAVKGIEACSKRAKCPLSISSNN